MVRSCQVEEAFPPVPFQEPRHNDTAVAYEAFHRSVDFGSLKRPSFLSWLRTVKSVSPAGRVVLRELNAGTLALAVRYRQTSGDDFLGQLCTMVLPHGGSEAFSGGPGGDFMLPHLRSARCLVGALAYLGSLRVDSRGGLRSDFYPDVLLDLEDFPRRDLLGDVDAPAESFVFPGSSLAQRAFSASCEDYLAALVRQHLRYNGHKEDRVATRLFRLISAMILCRKVVLATPQQVASLQLLWDVVVRGRSFAAAPEWSDDQLVFFKYIEEQLAVDCVWDLDANMNMRRCFLSGPPGSGKSEVLVHAAKLIVDQGCRVLFLAPTGALVHSYLDRLPDSESIYVDTVHAVFRFTRARDRRLVTRAPPSTLNLFDAIFLDEVSMLEEDVFESLYRSIQELPQRPIFVTAGDFAQLEAVNPSRFVRLLCDLFHQIQLTSVHRSRDPKHLAFVSSIRESQPSRECIAEYFDGRFFGRDEPLHHWVKFGMDQQLLHKHPFVWICNTNSGVARISLAALRLFGFEKEDLEKFGFPGDPTVKGTLPILPREGVWIRLTRNLEKQRGFVNGAIGRIEEVLQDSRDAVVFSLRLMSGTMVLVHPVKYNGEVFLPCVYGYACTVRRTQGLSLHHGALFLDGRVYPRPRGHAYVAVSRFRSSDGVFHYGPLRRSDWLPTDPCEGEQDGPGELSPRDWESESDEEHGSGPRRWGCDSGSDSEDGGVWALDNAGMACRLSESEASSDDEWDSGLARLASPEPPAVLVDDGSDSPGVHDDPSRNVGMAGPSLSSSESEDPSCDGVAVLSTRGASLESPAVAVDAEDEAASLASASSGGDQECAEEEKPREVDPALSDSSCEVAEVLDVSAPSSLPACSASSSSSLPAVVPAALSIPADGSVSMPPRLRFGRDSLAAFSDGDGDDAGRLGSPAPKRERKILVS